VTPLEWYAVWFAVFLAIAGIGRLIRWFQERHPPEPWDEDGWWERITADAGLTGSQLLSPRRDQWGWTSPLALRPGQTIEDAASKTARLESALECRRRAVRFEELEGNARHVLLRVVEQDPHAQPIPHPGVRAASVREPVTLGPSETGDPVRVRLSCRHAQISGASGSGKSGIANILVAAFAAAPDVVLWGVDRKGGMELGPWEDCFQLLARDTATTDRLFQAADRVIEARAAWMASKGLRAWPTSPSHPEIKIVVDEQGEVARDAKKDKKIGERLDSVARRGRAVGVTITYAIQKSLQDEIGSDVLRQQASVRISTRTNEAREVDVALGQGAGREGWQPERLRLPGKFLVRAEDQGHTIPRPARAYWLDDGPVERLAGEWAGRQPRLDAVSAAAAVDPKTPPRTRAGADV
jgi:S-DNA-T family DNA segregation ATPase FtsK/SpoIIIE